MRRIISMLLAGCLTTACLCPYGVFALENDGGERGACAPTVTQTEQGARAAAPAPQPGQALVNLAAGADRFTLPMEGPGTDYDPATNDIPIRDKEQAILCRLTDGVYGNGAILDGNWNGTGERSKYYEAYRNIDRGIILDLGAERNIQEVSMHVQEHPMYGISAPAVFTYYLSADGVNFNRVGRVSRFDATRDETPEHTAGDDQNSLVNFDFTLTGINYNARYVKVAFELTGTWAFMDEMRVNGLEQPAADADPLPDAPGSEYEKVNAYPTPALSGGIQHESLMYAGYQQAEADGPFITTHKTEEEILPVVAYLDEQGTIRDKFFESITFLPHLLLPDTTTADPTDGRYVVYSITDMVGNPNAAQMCARINEWQLWLDFLFDFKDENGNPCNLDALEAAAAAVKAATNDPNYKIGVKVSILAPILCQNDFGALPGTTRSLNFEVSQTNSYAQARADRLAAVKWYVDTVIERFNAKNYQNLRLDGFYWHHESIDYDVDPLAADSVKSITEYVHSLTPARKIYWIPSYQAPGFREWKNLGFDYAIMQPNYAFDANATGQRVDDCADLCKKYGLGVEMELGGISDQFIASFRDYLVKGQADKKQYQHDSLIAWYTSTSGIYETYRNKAGTRYVYDAMFDFFKGRETNLEEPGGNLAKNSKSTLAAENIWNQGAVERLDLSLLADGQTGNWNSGCVQLNKNELGERVSIVADLNGLSNLTNIELRMMEELSWGIGAPGQVTFSTSADGSVWKPLATIAREQAARIEPPGGLADLVFQVTTPVTAQYVKAEFAYAPADQPGELLTWMGADELVLEGSTPTAAPEALAPLGTVTLRSEQVGDEAAFAELQNKAAGLLKDGRMQTGEWAADYIGLHADTAAGPYTVETGFESLVTVNVLGIDFLDRTSWGIAAPEQVTYYYSADAGANWTRAGEVTKGQAVETALSDVDSSCYYELALPAAVRANAVKAVFERGIAPDGPTAGAQQPARWSWIGLDEVVVRGGL